MQNFKQIYGTVSSGSNIITTISEINMHKLLLCVHSLTGAWYLVLIYIIPSLYDRID